MSYTVHKMIHGKKYAYEVTSFWDPETKKVKKKNKYIGIVKEDGEVVNKHTVIKKQEKAVLDFGDGYLLHHFIKKSDVFPLLHDIIKNHPECISLIIYRLCYQSAMYNASNWHEGNVVSVLSKDLDLSSQNISRILAYLGQENTQRHFFQAYLNSDINCHGNVIIDATSLPNQIQHDFSQWGYADSAIEKQFRLLCVVNQHTKMPLFYRFLPGNIVDISSLQRTIQELDLMGAKNNFVLLDAGYCSKDNIVDLYQKKIDFLVRLPSQRTLYKETIRHHAESLENLAYATQYGTRSLFVKTIETKDLYGHEGYLYIVLDPSRKGKEVNQLVGAYLEETNNAPERQEAFDFEFKKSGIMILISSKKIEKSEVVSTYYMRQSVEQIFGFFKDDLDSLPIRRNNDATIQGYLFLQFIVLIFFIQLRNALQKKYTVEQALLITRNLKCKIFDSALLVSEANRKQTEIYSLAGVMVPKNLGI